MDRESRERSRDRNSRGISKRAPHGDYDERYNRYGGGSRSDIVAAHLGQDLDEEYDDDPDGYHGYREVCDNHDNLLVGSCLIGIMGYVAIKCVAL